MLGHGLRHVLVAAERVGQAAVHRLRRERQAVTALLQRVLHSQNLKEKGDTWLTKFVFKGLLIHTKSQPVTLLGDIAAGFG